MWELCNEWGYTFEELKPLLKELKEVFLIKSFIEYGTNHGSYRAEFDRLEMVDG